MLKWLRNLMRPSVSVTVTNMVPDDLDLSIVRDGAVVRIIASRREGPQVAGLAEELPVLMARHLGGSAAQLVARRAQGWARAAGSTLKVRDRISPSMVAIRDGSRTPEQQTLLAVACDLFDLLSSTSEGRQALADLGLQPLPEQRKAE